METVAETLGRMDKNPVEEIIKLMAQLPPDSQLRAWQSLLPFVHAQVKAPEAPQQPAFQVFANVDRAALLQAVNQPVPEIEDGAG